MTLLSGWLNRAFRQSRLSSVLTLVGLGIGMLAMSASQASALTLPYNFKATGFGAASPISMITGTFSIAYGDDPSRSTATLAPTATLESVGIVINNTTYSLATTGKAFRSSDTRFSLGGIIDGSINGIDGDIDDFLLTFRLGATVGTKPTAGSFTYSASGGEIYSASSLVVTPIPGSLALFGSALGLGSLLWKRRNGRAQAA